MALYAFGSNGSGQLGIGHKDDISTPTKCLFRHDDGRISARPQTTSPDIPVKIAAGGNHTLVLFSSGAAFAAGALGDAVFGGCGCGNGKNGNDDEKQQQQQQQQQQEETQEEKEQASNGNYVYADKHILDPQTIFRRISFIDPVSGTLINRFKSLSATWDASFFVATTAIATATCTTTCTATGFPSDPSEEIIYAYGIGSKGELGLGRDVVKADDYPRRIPDFPPAGLHVVDMDACIGHVAVVLSDGSLYGWGASRKGQLGVCHVLPKIVCQPSKVPLPLPPPHHHHHHQQQQQQQEQEQEAQMLGLLLLYL
ncbi:hypothetical protein KEM54_006439 [Ascosphaera aggregata]|nr:hypothetical protein KEM54_006439 [Ascosphaera aggregata]